MLIKNTHYVCFVYTWLKSGNTVAELHFRQELEVSLKCSDIVYMLSKVKVPYTNGKASYRAWVCESHDAQMFFVQVV